MNLFNNDNILLISILAIVGVITFVNLCIVHSSRPSVIPDKKDEDGFFDNKEALELVGLVEKQLRILAEESQKKYNSAIESIEKEEIKLRLKKEYYKIRKNPMHTYSQIDYNKRYISFADIIGTSIYMYKRNFDTGNLLDLPILIDLSDVDGYINFFINDDETSYE